MNRFHFVLTLVITQLLFINCDAAAVSATEKEPGKEVPSVPDSGKRGDPKVLSTGVKMGQSFEERRLRVTKSDFWSFSFAFINEGLNLRKKEL